MDECRAARLRAQLHRAGRRKGYRRHQHQARLVHHASTCQSDTGVPDPVERRDRRDATVAVVQIEIDRGLYLDEAMVRPHAGYAGFADRFARVVAELAGIAPAAPGRIAAE